MKILHLIYDHIHNPWVGGGGAVRVRELYLRMSDRHEITIVCGKYPGASDCQEGNLTARFVGSGRNQYVISTFSYAAKATGYLKAHADEFDIVVEDFAPYNPLFSISFARVPHVIQLHHMEGLNLIRRYFLLGLPFVLIERYYPKLFRNVICVSDASRKKFGITGAAIIPNGIESISETVHLEGDYLSFVGRLHIHNKGLDTLIAAMQEIDAGLGIAGQGRDHEKIAAAIGSLGLSGRVELKGFLTNEGKKEFISNSMFLVLPSRYEGQGIVVLEAAACGKPVIVSDIPELRYAVEAGFGLSFETGNAKDLAEKMKFLLRSGSLRKEMGIRAREYAKQFTWDKIVAEYENYLLRIVKESSV